MKVRMRPFLKFEWRTSGKEADEADAGDRGNSSTTPMAFAWQLLEVSFPPPPSRNRLHQKAATNWNIAGR